MKRYALLPFTRTALTAALTAALLSACSSGPVASQQKVNAQNTQPQAAAPKRASTLADLEQREITINAKELDKTTVEQALSNYQEAVQLFQDPAARLDAIRRMADLTMATTQQRESGDAPAMSDEDRQIDAKIDAEIDARLYQQFMQGALESNSQQEASTYLDLASNVASSVSEDKARVNYASAIKLYEDLLKNSVNANERAEAYYMLAKAYDLNGDLDKSLDALTRLAEEYPNSTTYLEAQFRRGELLFSNGEFDAATEAYAQVTAAGPANNTFFDQAQYKLGWSHYKLADYEKSLPVFFSVATTLSERLDKVTDDSNNNLSNKLLNDTLRVISMAFIQLDGPRSLKDYLSKNGGYKHEDDVYFTLGQVYLGQERYKDAADSFESFVNLYPSHARAPEFSSAIIESYRKGGFPSLVIPAKETFVSRYGVGSDFWKQAESKTRQNMLPLLQGHILDLAKHHHALAQTSNVDADFMKAANWYRDYLSIATENDSNRVVINQLQAEALFSAKHFAEAVTEFEHVAYDYPDHAKAEDAAYFALVAYQQHDRTLADNSEDKTAWKTRRYEANLKFAHNFPNNKNTPTILNAMMQDQLASKDTLGAVKTAGYIVSLNPPASETLQLAAWMTMGDGEFDLGRADVAEFAYSKVLGYASLQEKDRKKYQDRMAATVYKQAETLRDAKDIDKAVTAFLRVATISTNPDIQARSQFDGITLLLNNEKFERVIPLLEAFRTSYPKHELTQTVPDKLALAYEKTGNLPAAAHEYEGISDTARKGDNELSRQALWQAAEMYEKSGQDVESLRLFRKYITQFPQPMETRTEAQYRILKYFETHKDEVGRRNMLVELARTYQEAGKNNTPRSAYLGAMALFHLAEPRYDEFAVINLTLPLNKSLVKKKASMKTALETYSQIAAIGVAEFTTASNFKIGQIYRKLAADLMQSERPKGLDELALEQYSILLEEQALPFEDKAIELFVANANLTTQNIYDEWVRKSMGELAVMNPGRYGKHEQTDDYIDIIY